MPFTNTELETILYTLEGYLQSTNDDKYGDELVTICDKIIEELAPPKVTITSHKVDTLVGNMVASDDNNTDKVYPQVDDVPDNIKKEWLYNYTHDSEGC